MYNLIPYKKIKVNFKFNKFVKLFILNETLVWSVWYTILPILASFLLVTVPGSKVEYGIYGYTAYVISRIIGGLLSGLMFPKPGDKLKLSIVISGTLILSIAYAGFAVSTSILMFIGAYVLSGFALGFSTPVRFSLFSEHLDKEEEVTEWSMDENLIYIGTALAALLSGIILTTYSFQLLFILAAVINLFSIIPFVIITKHIGILRTNKMVKN